MVSEQIASLIDQEISQTLKTCYETSTRILSERIEILETIVKILMEKEVLEGEELEKLLYQNPKGGNSR
jgi:cell division protease FtsH